MPVQGALGSSQRPLWAQHEPTPSYLEPVKPSNEIPQWLRVLEANNVKSQAVITQIGVNIRQGLQDAEADGAAASDDPAAGRHVNALA